MWHKYNKKGQLDKWGESNILTQMSSKWRQYYDILLTDVRFYCLSCVRFEHLKPFSFT